MIEAEAVCGGYQEESPPVFNEAVWNQLLRLLEWQEKDPYRREK
ncbi:hypothetical protein [Pseudoxanthomonas sp. J35]|nr:hypothetical protein [Pseudoxanthomonas sp. J35]